MVDTNDDRKPNTVATNATTDASSVKLNNVSPGNSDLYAAITGAT